MLTFPGDLRRMKMIKTSPCVDHFVLTDVNSRARSSRSHNEPTIWRTFRFTRVLEQIVSEVLGNNVIVEEFLATVMLAIGRIEDVQGRVVLGLVHVFHVILHLHLHRVAFVVFAALELLVPVFLRQSLHRPFGLRLPAVLQTCDDYRLVQLLESVYKLLAVHIRSMDSLHVVLKLRELGEVLRVAQFIPCLCRRQFYNKNKVKAGSLNKYLHSGESRQNAILPGLAFLLTSFILLRDRWDSLASSLDIGLI